MEAKITKEELCGILEDFYSQILEIALCLDSLHALREIGNEKMKIANVFFFVTQRALIFRYSLELNKVINSNESMSINRICNICNQNIEHFNDSECVKTLCENIKNELKKHKSLSENLEERRNKTYAHNDKEFYFYNKKAIKDFPLDDKEITKVVNVLYEFALELNKKINIKFVHEGYPRNYDDVKKLFDMPTNDEKLDELEREKIIEAWNGSDKHDQL